ncbi:hypothetical protein AAF712_005505 [Marasmius tenuissimus]|uniref:Uncharacterized protein n=1 Tax=Marasmius tenuissimus TaxID=585030 RepID=A0ABR3A2H2_9AGAR
MRSLLFLSLCALSLFVTACEEVCMNGTVEETMRRYHAVVEPHFARKVSQLYLCLDDHESIAQQEQELQVPRALDPLRQAFQLDSPGALHRYIFKFFRGKCQRNGIEPEGCPNPDCPSRCGTPGSMVHFYPTFRRLAFTAVRDTIKNQTEVGSSVYKQIQARVEQRRVVGAKEAPLRLLPRAYANRDMSVPILYMRQPFEVYPGVEGPLFKRGRDYSVSIAKVLEELVQELEAGCGLEAKESTTDLRNCSWEREMKKFILQYP